MGRYEIELWRIQERALADRLRKAIERYCRALIVLQSNNALDVAKEAAEEEAGARRELEALEAQASDVRRQFRAGERY
jgi:hypothetical protein